MNNKLLTIVITLLAFVSVQAQYYEPFDCKVNKDGMELQFPFTGGFDAAQFSEADFNQDGLNDIFVFDRNGHSSLVFIRNNSNDNYAFELDRSYNKYFPKNLEGFVKVVDYNKDGLPDLFASAAPVGAAGIMLFEASEDNGELNYTIRRMGRQEGSAEIIWNKLPAGQVYNATTDIPSIVDVDFDGDYDILSFDEVGSYVYFCRNNQIEKGLPSDTMDFEIADFCFGKFQESGLSQQVILSSDPNLCASKFDHEDTSDEKSGVHAGSTVCAIDVENDSDFDLLLGDLTYNGIVFLENGGNTEQAFVTAKDDNFPRYDTPVEMQIFLSAFDIDYDADGLKDIVVCPNSQSSIQNHENVWLYKNTGDAAEPFELQTKNLFADQTLDFGSFSAPVIVDYNADGLKDVILASGGKFNGLRNEMQLVLLENVGTRDQAVFDVVDEDYLNFSDFVSTSTNPAPTFGDMDNDNDLDLIIGDEGGKLYYFENIAGANNTFDFAPPIYNWMDISAGQRIKPFIYDYNKDGLNDLIIGERNTNGANDPNTGEFVTGNLNYYQNQGTMEEPFFNPDVTLLPNYPVLGQVNVTFFDSASAKGAAAPYITEIDGMTFLIVGSLSGRISLYQITSTDPTVKAELLDDRLGGLVEGFYTTPILEDLNSDGVYEIVLGNSRGGMSMFTTDIFTTNTQEIDDSSVLDINVYPNPSTGQFVIDSDVDIQFVELFSMDGKRQKLTHDSSQFYSENIEGGIYLLRIVMEDGYTAIKRMVFID